MKNGFSGGGGKSKAIQEKSRILILTLLVAKRGIDVTYGLSTLYQSIQVVRYIQGTGNMGKVAEREERMIGRRRRGWIRFSELFSGIV